MPPVVYITNGPLLLFFSSPSLLLCLSFPLPFSSSFHFVDMDPWSYYPVNRRAAVIEPYASQAIIEPELLAF